MVRVPHYSAGQTTSTRSLPTRHQAYREVIHRAQGADRRGSGLNILFKKTLAGLGLSVEDLENSNTFF